MFKRILIGHLMDEAGDTQGGGGNPAPASDPTSAPATKTLTQEQVNALLAKERRTFEAKLSEFKTRATEADTYKAELEKLREEQELAGKTAAEQVALKYQKDRERLERMIADKDKAIAEREALAKAADETLRAERISTRLQAALAKQGLIPQHLDKAVRLAGSDISDVTIGENGAITASFGDLVNRPLEEVAAEWAKHNDYFLPAPKGGAGTRTPNGSGGGIDFSNARPADLFAEGLRQRRAAK